MSEHTRRAWYALGPGETREDLASVGGAMRLLVGAADSADTVSVLEQRLDGPGGPPLHVHDDTDEMLMVIEGGPLTVIVGDRRLTLEQGALAWIPRGTAHTFSNLSGAPLRFVGIATPGGIERALHDQAVYINGLAEGQRPEVARISAIWEGRGRIVGPPL